jgi:protein TonB
MNLASSLPPSRRAPSRWLDVCLRLALVVGVHIAVLLLLVRLDPDLRKKIEPVLVSLITPPAPKPVEAPPPPAPAPAKPPPAAKPAPQKPLTQTPPPPPRDLPAAANAVTVEPPTVAAPAAPAAQEPATTAPAAAPAPAPAAPPAAIAAPKPAAPVVPPRFDAAYLNNPRPEYPRVARRMGEHGKVVLRVYVTAAGGAEKVEVRTSSGSARLDQAAREAVERWKFVPARQGDDPVGAWVLVPITFMLEG